MGNTDDEMEGSEESLGKFWGNQVWQGLVIGGFGVFPAGVHHAHISVEGAFQLRYWSGSPLSRDMGVQLVLRRYVNGAWFDTAEIPPDRTTTGSFVQLDVQSETRVRGILTELEARRANLTAEEKQVRDLYTSYVDTDRVERLGLEPVRRDLATIAGLRTHEDVARVMASPDIGTESIFDIRIGVDDKNPDAYAVFARQSGLGLPDPDRAGDLRARGRRRRRRAHSQRGRDLRPARTHRREPHAFDDARRDSRRGRQVVRAR